MSKNVVFTSIMWSYTHILFILIKLNGNYSMPWKFPSIQVFLLNLINLFKHLGNILATKVLLGPSFVLMIGFYVSLFVSSLKLFLMTTHDQFSSYF